MRPGKIMRVKLKGSDLSHHCRVTICIFRVGRHANNVSALVSQARHFRNHDPWTDDTAVAGNVAEFLPGSSVLQGPPVGARWLAGGEEDALLLQPDEEEKSKSCPGSFVSTSMEFSVCARASTLSLPQAFPYLGAKVANPAVFFLPHFISIFIGESFSPTVFSPERGGKRNLRDCLTNYRAAALTADMQTMRGK